MFDGWMRQKYVIYWFDSIILSNRRKETKKEEFNKRPSACAYQRIMILLLFWIQSFRRWHRYNLYRTNIEVVSFLFGTKTIFTLPMVQCTNLWLKSHITIQFAHNNGNYRVKKRHFVIFFLKTLTQFQIKPFNLI